MRLLGLAGRRLPLALATRHLALRRAAADSCSCSACLSAGCRKERPGWSRSPCHDLRHAGGRLRWRDRRRIRSALLLLLLLLLLMLLLVLVLGGTRPPALAFASTN